MPRSDLNGMAHTRKWFAKGTPLVPDFDHPVRDRIAASVMDVVGSVAEPNGSNAEAYVALVKVLAIVMGRDTLHETEDNMDRACDAVCVDLKLEIRKVQAARRRDWGRK